MELSKTEKLAIIAQQEKPIAEAIYNQVIAKRVADRVEDKNLAKKATDELCRLEKIKDELNEMKRELENDN